MITFLFLLAATPSFAQSIIQTPTPIPNAIDDAITLCDSFAFDKNNCLTVVNGKDYFQKSLVTLCSGLPGMDADKITCLSLIGNKTANESSVQACNKKTWWDSTKSCIGSALKEFVKPAAAATPPSAPSVSAECRKEKVMDAVNKAIDQHKRMKFLPLYDTLIDLKYLLKACGY